MPLIFPTTPVLKHKLTLLCFALVFSFSFPQLLSFNYHIFVILFQALEVQNKHSEGLVELFKVCLIHRIFPPEENSVCFSAPCFMCKLLSFVCFNVQELRYFLLLINTNQFLILNHEMEHHQHDSCSLFFVPRSLGDDNSVSNST